jgi:hypothetical protein
MQIIKLETVDAFVAVDLKGVPGRGIVRLATRVLQGGARDLARSMTYSLASFGRQETGISAGISAEPEERDAAVAAFVAEVAVWNTRFSLSAGKGVTDQDLGITTDPVTDHLLAAGAVAAGLAAIPGASTAVVEGAGDAEGLVKELSTRGIEMLTSDDPFGTEADLLFCGSKVGIVDHEVADRLAVRAVVPTAPLPITTRAVAHCRRRKILALPDFVTTAGPLVGDAEEAREVVAAIIAEVAAHDDGPIIGACLRAEVFLSDWQDNLPFGRPMAP